VVGCANIEGLRLFIWYPCSYSGYTDGVGCRVAQFINSHPYVCYIFLPVVLYGCETWSLTVREKRRVRVFENRVLRRVFGSKRDEVTGE
jgi:hypothetical protein